MTKICHMTSVHFALDERIFQKECVSLAKEGYETYIVAKGESTESRGVKIIGVGEFSGNRIVRGKKYAKAVYKAAKALDADIYHLHDPELISYGKKLKKQGKTVIFDSHEDVPQQLMQKPWIPKPFRKTVASFYASFEKRALKKYDAVISVTPHICQRLEKINKNTVMITNYPEFVEESGDNFIRDKENIIVFAGGVDAQWGHEYIVKAIENIDVSYRVFGRANESYIDFLKSLKGGEKLEYLGKIPHESVKNELQKAALGVALCQYNANMGYKKGSLGNTKIFEYMRAKIPVVCTDFELWRAIIDEYKCGIYVNPSDVCAIEYAINEILSSKDLAKKMGEGGYRAVKEKYNWQSQEKILFELYRKLSLKTEKKR